MLISQTMPDKTLLLGEKTTSHSCYRSMGFKGNIWQPSSRLDLSSAEDYSHIVGDYPFLKTSKDFWISSPHISSPVCLYSEPGNLFLDLVFKDNTKPLQSWTLSSHIHEDLLSWARQTRKWGIIVTEEEAEKRKRLEFTFWLVLNNLG